MLKRVIVAILCMAWLPGMSMAAPAKGKKSAKTTKTAKSRPAPESSGGGSNSSIRAKKPIGASILYTPASDFILQYGASASYTLDAQIQLGFDFLMGSESTPDAEPDENGLIVSKSDLSGMAFYGYGRYFFTETFNVKAGLGYRSATIAYQIDDEVSGNYIGGDVSVSSIIMPVGLGNHWVWDSGLTIGVDWVTYMVALSGSSSATTETSFEVVEGEIEELNDIVLASGDKLAHTSTFTFALINIGIVF